MNFTNLNNIDRIKLAFEFINDNLFDSLLSLPTFEIVDDLEHLATFQAKKYRYKTTDIYLDAIEIHPSILADPLTFLANLLHEMQEALEATLRPNAATHSLKFVSELKKKGIQSDKFGNVKHVVMGSPFHQLATKLINDGFKLYH